MFRVLTLALPLACACSVRSIEPPVRSAADLSAAFESYRTYAVVTSDDVPPGFRRFEFPGEDRERLREVIREALTDRGLVEQPKEQADLWVYVSLGPRLEPGAGDSSDAEPQPFAGAQALEGDLGNDVLLVDAFAGSRHVFRARTLLRGHPQESMIAATEIGRLLDELPDTGEGPAPVVASVAPAEATWEDSAGGDDGFDSAPGPESSGDEFGDDEFGADDEFGGDEFGDDRAEDEFGDDEFGDDEFGGDEFGGDEF